jgi:hypothetical protein
MIQHISFKTWESVGKTNEKVTNKHNNIKKRPVNNAGSDKKYMVVRKDVFGTAVILELSHSHANVKRKQHQPIKQPQPIRQSQAKPLSFVH